MSVAASHGGHAEPHVRTCILDVVSGAVQCGERTTAILVQSRYERTRLGMKAETAILLLLRWPASSATKLRVSLGSARPILLLHRTRHRCWRELHQTLSPRRHRIGPAVHVRPAQTPCACIYRPIYVPPAQTCRPCHLCTTSPTQARDAHRRHDMACLPNSRLHFDTPASHVCSRNRSGNAWLRAPQYLSSSGRGCEAMLRTCLGDDPAEPSFHVNNATALLRHDAAVSASALP